MKLFFTYLHRFIVVLSILIASLSSFSQITPNVCSDPTNIIFGLTQEGTIYPINVNTGVVGTVIKNSTYTGNEPSASNALGYNAANGKFYYFKRNPGEEEPQEFVSFDPVLGIVTILANSFFTSRVHTGCVSITGLGYYAIDVNGILGYYNISANSWTQITTSFVDNYGDNVSTVIQTQIAGDIAIDGWGNMWIVTSSATNYGVYRLQAPIPTTPVASITVKRIVASTTATPTGNMIAGVAFNPTGQILLSTKTDNRLYVLENNLTTTYKGTFTVGDVGNDLTSCSFPLYVLPIIWKDFTASLKGTNQVELSWSVIEEDNKGFYIQYSEDGNNWNDIIFIPSRNIVEIAQSYSYTHINNGNGRVYYRIRQVNLNGRETMSEIKSVVVKNEMPVVAVWPNPVNGTLSVDNGNRESLFIDMKIFDMAGKLLQQENLQPGVNTMNVNQLNRGIYILKLTGHNQNYHQKFVKQ